MNLMGMRFKEFTWKNNPTELAVELGRRVKETALPYAESRTEDLGQAKRRVKGEGYFSGMDCMEQWENLRKVFAQGGPGSLQLPGQEPFLAVMDGLRLLGAPGKDLIRYGFSFTEYQAGAAYCGAGTHRAAQGESLWDYAWRYGREIEELVRANPQIRDIGLLNEGEEVKVP